MIDGQLLALAEEERFSRSRHARDQLPVEATAYCLAMGGLSLSDVDAIATSWTSDDPDYTQGDMYAALLAHPYFAAGRQPPLERVTHPVAHAAAAYFTSGFDEATIVNTDGVGDGVATFVGHARGETISVHRRYGIGDSLGLFYLGLTNHLGFRFGQEGKVMGLASYGEPDDAWMPFELDGDGYRSALGQLGSDRPNFGPPVIRAWQARIAERFGPSQPPPYRYVSATARLEASVQPDEWHRRVAASGQHVLERVLLHVIESAVRETGCRNLVIGGGVGLNCTANGAIWRSGLVDRLAVFPASGDAGTSAGAALAVAAGAGERSCRQPLDTAGLGPEFEDSVVRTVLQEKGVPFTESDDIAGAVADLLVDGQVVGWFQGRAEAGPRALGQRSILASPLARPMHERVNAIKNREQWRPLAPSLLADVAERYLADPGPSRFMLSACSVQESVRAEIPAVVHVDGTCRPQVVDDDAAGPYWRLLAGLGTRGHPEILLNTSFNLANEPIVHSPLDALRSFYGSGLDALAIGSMLVRKPAG